MRFFLLFIIAIPLAACEVTREQLDFSKKPPDEFAVTTRAPLEMPPNFDQLPSPRLGAPRPQEVATDTQAKQAIFGSEAAIQRTDIPSSGESILLQKAGAVESDSSIRDVIDAETEELAKENTPTIDRILGKAGKKIDAPATVVDPIKEAERLKTNRETGAPITEGETPMIEE
ncbi:MAG: DUF3035 domain-containing protein [Pseudomonadota bacterium]